MVTVATGVRDKRDNRSSQGAFTVINWVEDLDFDCNTATLGVTNDTLGTLIKLLIEQGIISGTVASA